MRAAHKNEPFERGVALFNAQEFFKAHEAWEELWLRAPATEKAFLQGIIQIAAAFHHYRRGNLRGSRSLLLAGIAKLSEYPATYCEVDVARLASEARAWIEAVGDPSDTRRHWPQIHRAGERGADGGSREP
jgi:uncharacterized protein